MKDSVTWVTFTLKHWRRKDIREFKQTLRQRVLTIEIFIQNKRNE